MKNLYIVWIIHINHSFWMRCYYILFLCATEL